MGALGKILVHYDQWSGWFKSNPHGGRIIVHTTKCISTTTDQFMERHLYRVYADYKALPLPPRRKGHRGRTFDIPLEQLRLEIS